MDSTVDSISTPSPNVIQEEKNDYPIGEIHIQKISLHEVFYSKESVENTIERHISQLDEASSPHLEDSLFLLAAHSGSGRTAYFEELDKLSLEDEVEIIYDNQHYFYVVDKIWEEEKNGFIHVRKEKGRQLILTTCSPEKENYQLIISCIETSK